MEKLHSAIANCVCVGESGIIEEAKVNKHQPFQSYSMGNEQNVKLSISIFSASTNQIVFYLYDKHRVTERKQTVLI